MQKNCKKFALIGTSCVGKSTLLPLIQKKLQRTYRGMHIISVPEAARHYFVARNARKPFSYFHQNNIQNIAKQFEQNAYKQNPDIIICDRSVLDAVVYVKTADSSEKASRLLDKIISYLATYHHFFLLDPNDVAYIPDKIRKESFQTRSAFHKTFLAMLLMLQLPYTLISGNQVKRLNTIQSIISTVI